MLNRDIQKLFDIEETEAVSADNKYVLKDYNDVWYGLFAKKSEAKKLRRELVNFVRGMHDVAEADVHDTISRLGTFNWTEVTEVASETVEDRDEAVAEAVASEATVDMPAPGVEVPETVSAA